MGPRFRGDERRIKPRGEPFPWPQALAIGLGVLRLSPEQFWRMTPRELSAALRGLYGDATPLDRAAFDALRERFPDHKPSSFETPAAAVRRAGSSG